MNNMQQINAQMTGAVVFVTLVRYTFWFLMFLMYFHPAAQYIIELSRILRNGS